MRSMHQVLLKQKRL